MSSTAPARGGVMNRVRVILATVLAAALMLAGCMAQPPGAEPRPDPHPGVEQCRDTDKPGYQRVCVEFTTYCDGHGTPFALTVDATAVTLDLRVTRWRDPVTGEESEVNIHVVDETKMTEDGSQALFILAIDYLMQIPPSILNIAAITGATATRGCDMFVAMSSPQTASHPHGTGLIGSLDDQDYFMAEEDFVPMTALVKLEIPYLMRPGSVPQ